MKLKIVAMLLVALLLLAGCNKHNGASETTQAHKHIQNATAPSFTGFDGVISDHEAKQIALEQAGVASEEELTYFNMGLEYDDGLAVYEIEFTHNGIEYEYDINAYTGEILSSEADLDD